MTIRNLVTAAAMVAVPCAMQAQVVVKHIQDEKSPIAKGYGWAIRSI